MVLTSRRSIRLEGYDYAQGGMYFVTICTHTKKCLFGHVAEGVMYLNSVGKMVVEEWQKTALIRDDVIIDAFVVMPNHIHGILILNTETPSGGERRTSGSQVSTKKTGVSSPSQTIGAIIRGFKGTVTRQVRSKDKGFSLPLWQRNYFEHIIRNEKGYECILNYIADNPGNWENDENYRR